MQKPFVALLRGVNVGGVKVLMKPLREMCERYGWSDVQTYIASGNLLFRADGDPSSLSKTIQDGLSDMLGRSPDVLTLPAADFFQIVESHPFSPEKGNQSHIYFCWQPPDIDLTLYEELKTPEETLKVVDGHVHLHAPEGLGRSKLANQFDKLIRNSIWTGRNLNTSRKLVDLLNDML